MDRAPVISNINQIDSLVQANGLLQEELQLGGNSIRILKRLQGLDDTERASCSSVPKIAARRIMHFHTRQWEAIHGET